LITPNIKFINITNLKINNFNEIVKKKIKKIFKTEIRSGKGVEMFPESGTGEGLIRL